MCRSFILFTLLTSLCGQLFGGERNQTPPLQREIVQVTRDSLDTTFVNHPTFAVFAGAPRKPCSHGSVAASPANSAVSGPWKIGITATVFWVGEPPTVSDPGNLVSAWDQNWLESARNQNSFYIALPYNDVANGHTKAEAKNVIPWFKQTYVRDGQSVLKDHWVAIRKGAKICYAQWEDVGPFQVDHWQYVFGNERPHPNRNKDAGIDVSPAVKEYLGMSGIDSCDWRFVSENEISQGPWNTHETAGNLSRITSKRTFASLRLNSPM
ncbi:MAG: hypothetical protein JO170_32575 [Verrucomicrobia bacterium]|nr:hypothetical protein [Verrucomicrobiota bacterium]